MSYTRTPSKPFAVRPSESDEQTAERIIEFATDAYARGEMPGIDSYAAVLNCPARFTKSIEAVIAVGIRQLRSTGATLEESESVLVDRLPALAEVVREAVDLERVLVTSARLERLVGGPPNIEAPCDCGPVIEGGQKRYRLLREAGRGSFGVVMEAVDRVLSSEDREARVAVKLTYRVSGSEWNAANEAVRARRIEHTDIVRVLDTGFDAELGLDFAVFEWVSGGTLAEHVASRPRYTAREAALLVAGLCDAVHAIHRAGLIHRDLKPSNIMIASDGRTLVADVGIAVPVDGTTLSEDSDARFGSWAFMAPEQIDASEALTTGVDVYALGAICAWLITGKPVAGETVEEITAYHQMEKAGTHARHLPGLLKGDLRIVIRRALSPEASDRHGTALDLARDLRRWVRGEPIEWSHPAPLKRVSLFVKRRPVFTGLASLVIIAMSVSAWQWHVNSVQRAKRAAWTERMHIFTDGLVEDIGISRAGVSIPERALVHAWFLDMLTESELVEQVLKPGVSTEHLIELAREQRDRAPEGSVERPLWGLMQGAWELVLPESEFSLVCVDTLTESVRGFTEILGEDADWTRDARSLLLCAHTRGMVSAMIAEEDVDLSRAAELAARLEEHRRDVLERNPGGAIHHAVLRSLRFLYKDCLRDRGAFDSVRAEFDAYIGIGTGG